MFTLTGIRILIIISILLFFLQQFSFNTYDDWLSSLLILQSHIELSALFMSNTAIYLAAFEILTLSYAFAALWLGYVSGKWIYICYLLLALADNFFIRVAAFSWLDNIISDLSFLVFGILLAIIFSAPLTAIVMQRKTRTWPVVILFFVFVSLFLLSGYINKLIAGVSF